MKSFIAWLLSPSRALQQANAEIVYLREENRRLNDLLTQAWETSRIVPVQAAHREPPAADTEQPKTTWGQQQREFYDRRMQERQEWEQAEQARLDRIRQSNDKRVN